MGTIEDMPRLALHIKFVLVIRLKLHTDHWTIEDSFGFALTIEDSSRLALRTKSVLVIRLQFTLHTHHGNNRGQVSISSTLFVLVVRFKLKSTHSP